MRMIRGFTFVFLVSGALSAWPAAGQSFNLELSGGVRPRAGGVEAAGVGSVALALHAPRVSVRLRLIDLVTITTHIDTIPGSTRYYWDTFSNGQQRCRDSSTGQFVSDSLCSGGGDRTEGTYEDRAGVGAELSVAVLNGRPHLSIGGGVRVGVEGEHRIDPYGQIYLALAPAQKSHLYILGTAGSAMVTGAELGYSIKLH